MFDPDVRVNCRGSGIHGTWLPEQTEPGPRLLLEATEAELSVCLRELGTARTLSVRVATKEPGQMLGKVVGAVSTGDLVVMETAFGRLVGRWRGRRAITAGQPVDVEIDVRQSYAVDRFEVVVDGARGLTVDSENSTLICGVVTDIDFQDVLTLDIGGSSLRFDLEGEVPLGLEGNTVLVLTDDLEIYPTEV